MAIIEGPDSLLRERGVSQQVDAFVVGCQFSRNGQTFAAALGDGTVQFYHPADRSWQSLNVHKGAVLSLAQDVTPEGFITGGDDGQFARLAPGAQTQSIAGFGRKWVEHVASWAGAKSLPLLACAVGKSIHLYDADGTLLKTVEHPSTVTGIAIDSKGKRVAASHYNGASIWFTATKTTTAKTLEWKGSHTGIAIHPAFEAIVTTMQENALHGWRQPDGQHMRMSGYPAKTESHGFTASGRWLATAGADAIVLWPFFGGGPMGKAPTELAGGDGIIAKRVACHPQHDVVAAGFADGLVVVADIARERILPVAGPGRGAISALCWSPNGNHLGFGTEDGFIACVDFSKKP
jgi:WD40 repeat protein